MRLSYGNIGLGPNTLGILRYTLPYNGVFHVAARYHDIAYGRGGNDYDRYKADTMFYRLMLSVSDNKLRKIWAYIYFKLVRISGQYYFKYKYE